MDEDELSVGESLSDSIKNGINIETDYLVIFIGPESVESKWVQKEIDWALDRETKLNRTFIIPVLLDPGLSKELREKLGDRIYLSCTDFTKSGVKNFSQKMYNTLFQLYLRLIEDQHRDSEKLKATGKIERMRMVRDKISWVFGTGKDLAKEVKLNKEAVREIIFYLEPMRKLELLLLYELQRGKFSKKAASINFEKVDKIKVELETKIGEWAHEIPSSFDKLKYDYGLGYGKYYVREELLEAISNLDGNERKELFFGLELKDCDFSTRLV